MSAVFCDMQIWVKVITECEDVKIPHTSDCFEVSRH